MGLAVKQHIIISPLRHKTLSQSMRETQDGRHIGGAFSRHLVQAAAWYAAAAHLRVKISVNFCKTGPDRSAALHHRLMLGHQLMQAVQLVLPRHAFGLPALVKSALHGLHLFLLKCSYFVLK
jgi:hypothetical protein